MATIHNRMPVTLPSEAWQRWLVPSADPLQGLLVPYRGALVAYPVASLVNRPRNQGPALVAPLG